MTTSETDVLKTMYPYSFDLISGCLYFTQLANETNNEKHIRYNNSACVIFAASLLEAVINEHISLNHSNVQYNPSPPKEFWEALSNAKKSLNLKDKWNLYVSMRGGTIWSSNIEPFQSYDLIIALRNELVHYKADFLEDDETPVKKLKPLLKKFQKDQDSYNENDSRGWVSKILESKELGEWVFDKVNYNTILDYLSTKP